MFDHLPWFRMYSEFATDPVVQSLAFEDQRHYVVLLCLKCSGVLDRNISTESKERIICRGLGLDPVTASEVKRRLMEVGLISKNWQPNAWEKRQFISDGSTQRVRKYRKSKATGNVSGTFLKRFGNGPETERETDPDKDPEVDMRERVEGGLGGDPHPPSPSLSQKASIAKKLEIPKERLEVAAQLRADLTQEEIAASYRVFRVTKPNTQGEWKKWICREHKGANGNGGNGHDRPKPAWLLAKEEKARLSAIDDKQFRNKGKGTTNGAEVTSHERH